MKIICLFLALCCFLTVCNAGRAGNPPDITIELSDRFLIYEAGASTYLNPWVPTDPDAALQILNAHNAVRKDLGLRMLSWSYQLEQSSWFWNRNCVPAHDPKLPLNVGENIFSITSEKIDHTDLAIGGIQQWLAEIANYDCQTDTCNTDKNGRQSVCGHFVQAIWNSTTHVGCSIIDCTENSPFAEIRRASNPAFDPNDDNWTQMVCRYYPPAYEGERPVPRGTCARIESRKAAGAIKAVPKISTGKGPLGRLPSFGNTENSISTTAKRVILK